MSDNIPVVILSSLALQKNNNNYNNNKAALCMLVTNYSRPLKPRNRVFIPRINNTAFRPIPEKRHWQLIK